MIMLKQLLPTYETCNYAIHCKLYLKQNNVSNMNQVLSDTNTTLRNIGDVLLFIKQSI